ncbi:MAG: NAD(P)/FAD-dependent oxidoreductase [Deferribacterales bacterium]
MKIVTVGTGMAATEFVSTLREQGSRDEIIMISPEDLPPYSPCSMPFFLAGEPLDTVYWKGADFYQKYGAQTVLGESATEIDPDSQVLTTDKGRKIEYDRLFFSSGSKSWYPDPSMLSARGVFGFKTLTDLLEIDAYLKEENCGNAVVFGGGFIGVDAALCLHHRGLDVTLVHRNNRVLSQMTDNDGGIFATELIKRRTGVKIILKNVVERINTDNGQLTGVVLTDGTEIDTRLLILSVGVSPNSESLTGKDSGVTVDGFLKYSGNIFAAGDVAVTKHKVTGENKIYGTYPNARAQAKNCALGLIHGEAEYEGSINTNVLKKHIDFSIIAAGIYEGEQLTFTGGDIFRRIYLKDGKINGYQIVGDTLLSGYIYGLYVSQKTVSEDFLKAFGKNDSTHYYRSLLMR